MRTAFLVTYLVEDVESEVKECLGLIPTLENEMG
jgi:hypothetical protein